MSFIAGCLARRPAAPLPGPQKAQAARADVAVAAALFAHDHTVAYRYTVQWGSETDEAKGLQTASTIASCSVKTRTLANARVADVSCELKDKMPTSGFGGDDKSTWERAMQGDVGNESFVRIGQGIWFGDEAPRCDKSKCVKPTVAPTLPLPPTPYKRTINRKELGDEAPDISLARIKRKATNTAPLWCVTKSGRLGVDGSMSRTRCFDSQGLVSDALQSTNKQVIYNVRLVRK